MRLTQQQRAWQWKILVATYMAYVGYYLTRKSFTICKTSLHEEFGWDMAKIAHIWTLYLIAYMLGQFLNGLLGRYYGPRLLLLGGLGVSIVCNFAFGLMNSYEALLALMLVNGFAQATGWPAVVGGVAHWLRSSDRGSIMGVWSSSYLVGNNLVKILGAVFLAEWGWRWSFFGFSILTLGIWALVLWWQRDRPEDVGLEPIVTEKEEVAEAVLRAEAREVAAGSAYLHLLMNPVILMMGASYFCVKFLRYALDSWLPAFLDFQGMGKGEAAFYSSIFDFAGIGGAVLAGLLLDRVFRRDWAMVCLLMGIGCVGSYLLILQGGGNPYVLAVLCGLVGVMLYGPDTLICGAAAVTVAGERNALAVAGIVNGIGSIGPIVQEEVIGWLMKDASGLEEKRAALELGMRNTNYLFLAMSGVFVVMMFLQIVLQRRVYGRRLAAV